jgi:hypothetical protein
VQLLRAVSDLKTEYFCNPKSLQGVLLREKRPTICKGTKGVCSAGASLPRQRDPKVGMLIFRMREPLGVPLSGLRELLNM